MSTFTKQEVHVEKVLGEVPQDNVLVEDKNAEAYDMSHEEGYPEPVLVSDSDSDSESDSDDNNNDDESIFDLTQDERYIILSNLFEDDDGTNICKAVLQLKSSVDMQTEVLKSIGRVIERGLRRLAVQQTPTPPQAQ